MWCAAGAGAGLALALAMAGPGHSPFLFASLGGSAVFLFGLGNAPAAQPRALFRGHLGSALIGIACAQHLGSGAWVYALAQALTLVFMITCRTVHPPAGANAMIMVHAHAGYGALLQPVLIGVICLAGSAFLWSRLWSGAVHYPVSWRAGSRPVDWGSQACGIDEQYGHDVALKGVTAAEVARRSAP
ncbi:HPP family protein [Variovorax sp. WS11]|uniref:HPP family protein n=2 Tax=Variovorax sp. WS11 TaxID=1105204 RepID=UPI000D0DEF26|nr:HPP family protein [Variovorax sp. WS11]NDZ19008.1 HPP family protein [Variovorax sp. WS11]PSL79336.1 HPP family protein [Variovorax sp. WS11]